MVTLDPNKFAEKKQQRLHISDLKTFRPHIILHNQSRRVRAPNLRYDHITPYPPDTKAFLYYFTSPEKTRLSGELRFRVASSDDPASFETGSDLMKINGQTWSRPLIDLSKCYNPLYEKLREELLVPDDLDAVLSTFPRGSARVRHSQFLYTLNDAFIVNLTSYEKILIVVTEQGFKSLRLRVCSLFKETRDSARLVPYTGESPSLDFPKLKILNEFVGSALVRFERSTFPDHKGTRTVVLRFLKIITPVKCLLHDSKIVQPEEGKLHRKYSCGKTVPLVWSVNIDKKKGFMAQGLQSLWDAS